MAASTRGTGELIAAAVADGAQVVLVACGGSATTDGAAGAIEAIEEAGGLGGAKIVCVCDVRTPFERAAEVFGPQKGADPATVKRLTKRLNDFAADAAARSARQADDRLRRRAHRRAVGAVRRGARARRGLRARRARLRRAHARRPRASSSARASIDEQTLQGKIAGEIATRARQAGVPCFAIVGTRELDAFGARMLDLQRVLEATDLEAIAAAAASLADVL